MRIRKNLKLSAQFSATSSHICKLNQSSWDVMSSPPSIPRPPSPSPPPPPLQVDGGIVSAGNEGLDLLAAAAEMELENIARERNSSDDKNKNNNDWTDSATKKLPLLESRSCPKNASTSSDSDMYIFYLGFGVPGRGKRRGEHSDNGGPSSSASTNPGHEDELNPLYLGRMVDDDLDYDEDEQEETREKGKKRAKKPVKARSLKSLK